MIDASIIVVSYNHEKYIKQCLSSILAQQTNKKIEIIWYDDCSTDETIRNGEEVLKGSKFEIIRLHAINNRKQKKIPFRLDIIEQCRGRFIFHTDGDDFWIDPKKIDIQIDALDRNPNINVCFTPAFIFDDVDPKPAGLLGAHSNNECIFSTSNVIEGDGGFMPTNSLCIRRNFYDSAPDWFYEYLPVGDYPMQVIAAHPNGALYLPNITSGYRKNVNGSWTTTIYNIPKNRLIFEVSFLETIRKLNDFMPENHNAFKTIIHEHVKNFFKICTDTKDYSELKNFANVLNSIKNNNDKY